MYLSSKRALTLPYKLFTTVAILWLTMLLYYYIMLQTEGVPESGFGEIKSLNLLQNNEKLEKGQKFFKHFNRPY